MKVARIADVIKEALIDTIVSPFSARYIVLCVSKQNNRAKSDVAAVVCDHAVLLHLLLNARYSAR